MHTRGITNTTEYKALVHKQPPEETEGNIATVSQLHVHKPKVGTIRIENQQGNNLVPNVNIRENIILQFLILVQQRIFCLIQRYLLKPSKIL